jgi:hypothetical protein
VILHGVEPQKEPFLLAQEMETCPALKGILNPGVQKDAGEMAQ